MTNAILLFLLATNYSFAPVVKGQAPIEYSNTNLWLIEVYHSQQVSRVEGVADVILSDEILSRKKRMVATAHVSEISLGADDEEWTPTSKHAPSFPGWQKPADIFENDRNWWWEP